MFEVYISKESKSFNIEKNYSTLNCWRRWTLKLWKKLIFRNFKYAVLKFAISKSIRNFERFCWRIIFCFYFNLYWITRSLMITRDYFWQNICSEKSTKYHFCIFSWLSIFRATIMTQFCAANFANYFAKSRQLAAPWTVNGWKYTHKHSCRGPLKGRLATLHSKK